MVYDKNGHFFTAILLNSEGKFSGEADFAVPLVQFHAELRDRQA